MESGAASPEPTRSGGRTATSNFGVGKREGHDATAFYARFVPPEISADDEVTPHAAVDQIWHGDARAMDANGAHRRRFGRPGGHLAALLRRQGLRGGARRGRHPRRLPRVPRDAPGRVRRVRPQARTGRADRGQRRQPGSQAVPVAVVRRHRHPRGPRSAAAGRGHLAEGQERRRFVRLGQLPAPRQPRAARRHRAHHRRLQGPVRPGGRRQGPSAHRHAERRVDDRRRLPRVNARRLGVRPRERPPGQPPGAVPGRAAQAPHRPLHLRRRSRPRPVHGRRLHGGGGGPGRSTLRGVRHRRHLHRRRARTSRAPSRTPTVRPSRSPSPRDGRPRRPPRPATSWPPGPRRPPWRSGCSSSPASSTSPTRPTSATGASRSTSGLKAPTGRRGSSWSPAASRPHRRASAAPTSCGGRSVRPRSSPDTGERVLVLTTELPVAQLGAGQGAGCGRGVHGRRRRSS